MLWRRRLCRKSLCFLSILCILIYVCFLLLGDLRTPVVSKLTELHRCPACYGVSICPELYSNKITIDTNALHHFFNSKNVYYGQTSSGKRVVLKKLAHDWEMKEVDRALCALIGKTEHCPPSDLINITNIEDIMVRVLNLKREETTLARSGLILCPNTDGLKQLISQSVSNVRLSVKDGHIALLNALVLLLTNAEPLLLMLLDSRSWPVPAYGGACGRLSVMEYTGAPLAGRLAEPWLRRLRYAQQILRAAMDFTFKHDRFRFYLMDWSLDNIVTDDADRVTFVDLEDVIVLDKYAAPDSQVTDWYKRYTRGNYGPGYLFSIDNMCQHHLSDHNLWSACYLLAGETPLLLPVPERVKTKRPHVEDLLNDCLRGEDRWKAVERLQKVFEDILADR